MISAPVKNESPPASTFNFERNMAALARVNEAAAEFLRHSSPVEGAAPTMGRDGEQTFAWSDADGRLHWLGRTSMPSVSTPALLDAYQPGHGNSLLVEIGQGEEVKQLATRLAAHQAVFVVIEQPAQAVLALRLHDYASEIAAGRIVFCAGDDPWAQLRDQLVENAGYLVPDRVLCRPWYEPAFVTELSRRLETLGQDVDRLRSRQATHVPAATRSSPSAAGFRIAVVSNALDPAVVRLSDSLEDAGATLGWQCRRHTLTTPRWVHPAAIQSDLHEFQPEICLVIGAPPRGLAFALPACPTAVICSHGWGLAEDWLAQVPDDVTIVVRSPAQLGQLQNAGIAADRQHFWPPAARAPASNAMIVSRDKVVVMSDGLDPSPEAVGLNLDTHQKLWHEARKLITAQVASYTDDDAPAILRMAARNLGIALTSEEVTSGLESRIRAVLGPATVREAVLRSLIDAGVPFEIYGMGRFTDESIAARHRGIWPAPRQSAPLAANCRAVIAIETGAALPDGILDCAAAGGNIFQRAAVSKLDHIRLAGLDGIASGIFTFRSPDSLRKLLDPNLRQKDRADVDQKTSVANLLATSHTWRHRLTALRQQLTSTNHSLAK